MPVNRISFSAFVVVIGVLMPVVLLYLPSGYIGARNFLPLSCGVVAFSLMSINLILSIRNRGFERLAGGLDSVYFVHKWTGICIVGLVLVHKYVGVRINGLIATSELAESAVSAAKTVFPILLFLLAVSALKRIPRLRHEIPYQVWKYSHKLIGPVYLVIVFHMFFVKAPFSAGTLISQYLLLLAALGIASYLYIQVAPFIRKRNYRVTAVELHPSATIVTAIPTGRIGHYDPGQFAFLSVAKAGLRESHPFSISAMKPTGEIEFSIRPLGDFTRALRSRIAVGDLIRVEGGYGRFHPGKKTPREIWVAGGIGITPFLALADALEEGDDRQIALIYCVSNLEDAIGLQRLSEVAARARNFSFHIHASRSAGRLTASALLSLLPFSPREAGLWYCGPSALRSQLLSGLKSAGEAPQSVHFELFEFR